MVVKVKESFEKTRHVKNNDKSKKYILRGQRNVRYHDSILSNTKKSYKFSISFSFDRARTFTQTIDRNLLLWRGKMILNFLFHSWKMMMNFLLLEKKKAEA